MKRRRFLTVSGVSMGTVFLSQCAIAQNHSLQSQTSQSQVYTSKDGLLNINMEAGHQSVNLGGNKAYLMSYNGQVPGPRLEGKPGDTVKIRFTNKLSHPSNLHYHGLHIPPTGKGDNPFLEVPPGETFNYEFTIPKNHRGGTFWYHPHVHHVTAVQVFGGLAGLFVIRGELDEIPEIKSAREEFIVLQDFALDGNGQILPPSQMELMMGREGNVITLNGQFQPTLSIAKGGLLRLRLLNASPSRFYRIALEDHPLYLIATDGGSLSETVELKELLLTPGERAEILIKGERETGQYRLLNLPYNRGGMGMMGHGMMGHGMMGHGMMRGGNNPGNPQTLATLSYKGSISPLKLPQKLIPIEDLPEAQKVRRFELSMNMLPGQGMVFLLNGKKFDPQRIDTQVKLNTVEDWELVNVDPDRMDHPFHLHTNTFQVLSRDGQREPYLSWKDTILVKGGETVKIRVNFQNFPGKTVYHCHILDHEDLGMMGIIEMT